MEHILDGLAIVVLRSKFGLSDGKNLGLVAGDGIFKVLALCKRPLMLRVIRVMEVFGVLS